MMFLARFFIFFVCGFFLAVMAPLSAYAQEVPEEFITTVPNDSSTIKIDLNTFPAPPLTRAAPFSTEELNALTDTQKNDPDVQYRLGYMYYYGQNLPRDDEQSVKWFKLASAEGNVKASAALALSALLGQGMKPDLTLATLKAYEAAKANNALGLYLLAGFYAKGRGVEQDTARAERLYYAAGEHGLPQGYLKLADRFITSNRSRAQAYYRKALESISSRETPSAQDKMTRRYAENKLKLLCYNGALQEKDPTKSVMLFKEAATYGSIPAMVQYGRMLMEGKGITRDSQAARSWFLKAAEQGSRDAKYELGEIYFNGIGTAPNYDKAFNYYLSAAEEGHAGAAYSVGNAYQNGYGVEANQEKAKQWYARAQALGKLRD